MTGEIQKIFEHVRTNDLVLRMPNPEDAPFVFSIEGDPETNQYRPAGPMRSLHEAEEKVSQWCKDWLRSGYGYWVASLPSEPDIIGIGGVRTDRWQERDVLHLYYRFSPKSWGRGYATELARVAVDMSRQHLSKQAILARIRPTNKPSIRVAEKIGLEHRPELDTSEHMVFTLGWS